MPLKEALENPEKRQEYLDELCRIHFKNTLLDRALYDPDADLAFKEHYGTKDKDDYRAYSRMLEFKLLYGGSDATTVLKREDYASGKKMNAYIHRKTFEREGTPETIENEILTIVEHEVQHIMDYSGGIRALGEKNRAEEYDGKFIESALDFRAYTKQLQKIRARKVSHEFRRKTEENLASARKVLEEYREKSELYKSAVEKLFMETAG